MKIYSLDQAYDLFKSRVRSHYRKTKSGKTAFVPEHTDKRSPDTQPIPLRSVERIINEVAGDPDVGSENWSLGEWVDCVSGRLFDRGVSASKSQIRQHVVDALGWDGEDEEGNLVKSRTRGAKDRSPRRCTDCSASTPEEHFKAIYHHFDERKKARAAFDAEGSKHHNNMADWHDAQRMKGI